MQLTDIPLSLPLASRKPYLALSISLTLYSPLPVRSLIPFDPSVGERQSSSITYPYQHSPAANRHSSLSTARLPITLSCFGHLVYPIIASPCAKFEAGWPFGCRAAVQLLSNPPLYSLYMSTLSVTFLPLTYRLLYSVFF
jgi:hypothetical protein